MSKLNIGEGYSVDEAILERYWLLIGDRPQDKRYRSRGEIQYLEEKRVELHKALIKSAGFDPELRFKESQYHQPKTEFWKFMDALNDYIAHRLAKEGSISALNNWVLSGGE